MVTLGMVPILFNLVDATRLARKFSLCVHVVQDDRGILLNAVCVFLKNHSISSMFHRTLLDPQMSPHFFHVLSYTCTGFVYLSFAGIPVDDSIHCHSARRVVLWPTG